ncbi:putative NAD binding protein [Trypoxylus dichotomus]
MSCNYADGLSPYEDKGVLGIPEKFNSAEDVEQKCAQLAEWIKNARHVVVHTGAGISTSAGIPDFRGPKGVWTLEKKGMKPDINISFNDAIPTKTHMALKKLIQEGYVRYIVSQNIDGLHLRTGISRENLAELHGDMFIEQCNTCDRQYIRKSATTTVGQKCLETNCPRQQISGRACRGKLCDTILDWEDNLPESDLKMAELHSSVADINICLGTTLQIVPSGNLPLCCKKYGGKVIIVNLQPTKHDKKADMIINTYVDDVLVKVMKKLGVEIPEYDTSIDPTKTPLEDDKRGVLEWTIRKSYVDDVQSLYDIYCKNKRRKIAKTNKKQKSVDEIITIISDDEEDK